MENYNYSQSIDITGIMASIPAKSMLREKVIFYWRREFRGPKIVSWIHSLISAKPFVAVPGIIIELDENTLKFYAISSGKPRWINKNDKTKVPQIGMIYYEGFKRIRFKLESVDFIEQSIPISEDWDNFN